MPVRAGASSWPRSSAATQRASSGRGRCMLSKSPVAQPQLPGQWRGPAACTGHRQSQPDTRQCEVTSADGHEDQASADELLR
jgi:hypothetical protein